ncbi:hypothetical protein ACFXPV_38690 [Streptomyces sp. NPDC059118]|uniref:hypothetical protein n=1 Tax=unclassified Streptomyces TaxID=2593676 RepID=UPI0036C4884B
MCKIKVVPRLCVAVFDRLTFGGDIIETSVGACRLATTHARAAQQPATSSAH